MKVKGRFMVVVRDRNDDRPIPEGEWVFESEVGTVKNHIPTSEYLWVFGKFQFWSDTCKTGGELQGHFAAPGVFEGSGTVWGPADSILNDRVEVGTANVKAVSIGTVHYVGSLREFGARSPQDALLLRNAFASLCSRIVAELRDAGVSPEQLALSPTLVRSAHLSGALPVVEELKYVTPFSCEPQE